MSVIMSVNLLRSCNLPIIYAKPCLLSILLTQMVLPFLMSLGFLLDIGGRPKSTGALPADAQEARGPDGIVAL